VWCCNVVAVALLYVLAGCRWGISIAEDNVCGRTSFALNVILRGNLELILCIDGVFV
jgi:hypothetical protein